MLPSIALANLFAAVVVLVLVSYPACCYSILEDLLITEFEGEGRRFGSAGQRYTATTQNPEDQYTVDPILTEDPLDLDFLTRPNDFAGRSVLGVLSVHQMRRMAVEPYSGAGLPVPPVAAGPAPAPAPSHMLPYLLIMNSGGGNSGGDCGGGGGDSG